MDYSLLVGIHIADTQINSVILPCEIPYFKAYKGGMISTNGEVVYIIGIIDQLQSWNYKKMGENFAKSIIYLSTRQKISAVPPLEYGTRFRKFVLSIFE